VCKRFSERDHEDAGVWRPFPELFTAREQLPQSDLASRGGEAPDIMRMGLLGASLNLESLHSGRPFSGNWAMSLCITSDHECPAAGKLAWCSGRGLPVAQVRCRTCSGDTCCRRCRQDIPLLIRFAQPPTDTPHHVWRYDEARQIAQEFIDGRWVDTLDASGDVVAGTKIAKVNTETKKSYQEIVRFADDFLKGGIFDFYLQAYSQSQTVQIEMGIPGS